jgi:WD40 repeat protein
VIRLWDLSTGGEQYHLMGHTGSVTGLAWDCNAEVLISGSFDTTVRLWQLNPGKGEITSAR